MLNDSKYFNKSHFSMSKQGIHVLILVVNHIVLWFSEKMIQ